MSYPTARARFNDLLVKLGLADEPAPAAQTAPKTREQILADVAVGAVSPAEAQPLLAEQAR